LYPDPLLVDELVIVTPPVLVRLPRLDVDVDFSLDFLLPLTILLEAFFAVPVGEREALIQPEDYNSIYDKPRYTKRNDNYKI
jgi:hypothetical protein